MASASTHPNQTRGLIRTQDLPDRVQAGLRAGYKAAGYKSERSMLFGLLLSALHRGVTFSDLSISFRTGTLRCRAVTGWQVAGGDQRADRELLKLWQAAEEQIGVNADPLAVAYELTDLRDAIEVLPLPGRGGPSERAVLIAVVSAGLAQSSLAPRISYVELAIATGRADSTVEDALGRLLKRGYLTRAAPGAFDRRTRWSINAAAVRAASRGDVGNPVDGSKAHPDLVPSASDDLWSALSLVSWELLRLLATHGGHTAGEAAQALGRNVRVVRQHLNRLRDDHELVARDSDRAWTARLDSAALDAAATRCGVDGASARHEQRIRTRDAARRQWIEGQQRAAAETKAFRRVKEAYAASSFLGASSSGALRFRLVNTSLLTWSAWKSAGCPEDYHQVPGLTR